MCITEVWGEGVAEMTYSTDGGGEQNVIGAATTVVGYQDGQPVVGYLQINCDTINLSFGIDPFAGTGSYNQLPYFAFTEAAVLGPDCHGLWTTSDDPPVLDVTTFTISGEATIWAMALTANLVWFVEDCEQPPLSLNVSSLTMNIRQTSSADAAPRADFDGIARLKTTDLARQIGVSSFPA